MLMVVLNCAMTTILAPCVKRTGQTRRLKLCAVNLGSLIKVREASPLSIHVPNVVSNYFAQSHSLF